ncbi:MAG: phosphotransferase family protein [Venatoribacter sp.]
MSNNNFIDEAKALRDSDSFDVQAVHAWLKEQSHDYGDELPQVRQFSGGASNLTYHLKYPDKYADNDLILRRPPAGKKAAGAHDMKREFSVMARLKPVYPYVPKMIAFCDDDRVLGSDFYIMERMRGIIPRANFPRGMQVTPEQARKLGFASFDKLIELHQVDIHAAGLDDLGKGEGYVKRQVEGWCKRYQDVETWNVPSFKKVMRWLNDNQPQDVSTCLIHNDFRMDNLVLDADNLGEIIGVLDWEMCTLGDPLMDLGGALAYWVEATDGKLMLGIRRQPSHVQGMPTRQEIVDYYCQKMGFDKTHWPFYEAFGVFRLAVIAQQIYYRYHHKQTDNPAFKNFWFFIHILHRKCKRIIKEARR